MTGRRTIAGGTLIGGHEGLDVWRTPRGIEKHAYDDHNREGIARAAQALSAMSLHAPFFAPRLLAVETDCIVQQDLGDSEPPADAEALRHAAIRLLRAIRAAGLRHGDLTSHNLIVSGNPQHLSAIDWQEAHALDAVAPQKSPRTDSYFLMRYLRDQPDRHGMADTPRIARRWIAVLADLGAHQHHDQQGLLLRGLTFVDFGCFQGDFTALAAAEGMDALGIDQGGFRSGENSIQIAVERWTSDLWARIGGRLRFQQADLIEAAAQRVVDERVDVACCFSTWPYLVRDYGRERAASWLRWAIDRSAVLYFETQLAGDGPGPDFLPDLAAVRDLLGRCGAETAEPIVTIPVSGREAARTVWRVE